jgi:hypothetical protein
MSYAEIQILHCHGSVAMLPVKFPTLRQGRRKGPLSTHCGSNRLSLKMYGFRHAQLREWLVVTGFLHPWMNMDSSS